MTINFHNYYVRITESRRSTVMMGKNPISIVEMGDELDDIYLIELARGLSIHTIIFPRSTMEGQIIFCNSASVICVGSEKALGIIGLDDSLDRAIITLFQYQGESIFFEFIRYNDSLLVALFETEIILIDLELGLVECMSFDIITKCELQGDDLILEDMSGLNCTYHLPDIFRGIIGNKDGSRGTVHSLFHTNH